MKATSHPADEFEVDRDNITVAKYMIRRQGPALDFFTVSTATFRLLFDLIYGEAFRRQAAALGIQQIPTAPQSPWQNPYAERVIGSIRPECLDR